MTDNQNVDSRLFSQLLNGGYENLNRHMEEVNDLNVFPIPDGDTGSNMLMTVAGGSKVAVDENEGVGSAARRIADGMLLSARGNSGVILSQFFDGIADGLKSYDEANADVMRNAFKTGVAHAYASVMKPTEGTILTVSREASEYAAEQDHDDLNMFFSDFLRQARITLSNTPDMLPVLKKAGVVDSGGAGLIYIVEGMANVLSGEQMTDGIPVIQKEEQPKSGSSLNLDLFNEDSVLEFGYCTEVLLRLQRSKVEDIENFDVNIIKDYLQTIGDSIVCFKTGSIVKMHVHTMTPYKVLEFCQRYGEYLTTKIENMSLQHNNLPSDSSIAEEKERTPLAVVAVASGEGIKQTFRDMGTDYIVDGGQSMNPSTDDFIEAFNRVNADTIIVLPNNGNIILAAKQAAKMYEGSDVRVVESKTIGEGYAALTMFNTEIEDTDELVEELTFAMEGVITGIVSKCCRDTEMDGFMLKDGQYIGFVGKDIVSADNDRRDTACMLSDRVDFEDREICILIRGTDSNEEEAEDIANHIRKAHKNTEVFIIDGGQDIYSYILIVE